MQYSPCSSTIGSVISLYPVSVVYKIVCRILCDDPPFVFIKKGIDESQAFFTIKFLQKTIHPYPLHNTKRLGFKYYGSLASLNAYINIYY
jgi:hypothetical protein